jgi:hypothetical protein
VVAGSQAESGPDVGRDDQAALSAQHHRGIHDYSVPRLSAWCH